MQALILDCDGVLADTERELHLPAFNEAFAEAGLALRWSEAEYEERLKTAGGKERLAEIAPSLGIEDAVAWAAELHTRKTAIFKRRLAAGDLEPRPGIVSLVDEVLAAGMRIAVASTSAEKSVRGVVRRVLGDRPVLVVAGDVVPAKKPDPAIYLLALRELGVDAAEAVAIEDTRNGVLAAAGAGIACVAAPSSFTHGD
ncbi:MAG: HAD-IA family hydrolase, partial [Actinobacteria bacterium]|nr:HAD-IA family hydrolase [Actinomycetota bacterium]